MNNFKYGLLGKRLGHSLSKEIHTMLSDIDYQLIEVNDVKDILTTKNFLGLNVTIPYKETVMKYLDHIDKTAKEIGCVNTIVNKQGILYGYNTDGDGFENLLKINDISIKNKKVVILGNGGSSKTVTYICKKLEAKSISYIVRNIRNKNEYTVDNIDILEDTDVIINTTPLGMYPNNYNSFIDLTNFNKLSAVVDIIYNPLNTSLIREAKAKNIKAVGGLYMLVYQAAKAQEYYFNKKISNLIIEDVYYKILRNFMNIVLIGMPMSGKSYIGIELAKNQKMLFIDLDKQLEHDYNIKIENIFKTKGENYFRKIETETVKKYSTTNHFVISTGGGVVKNPQNIDYLKQNGLLIFIDRPLDLLKETDPENRPLLKDIKNLERLYKERYNLYSKYADITIKNTRDIQQVVEDIEVKINEILRNKWS